MVATKEGQQSGSEPKGPTAVDSLLMDLMKRSRLQKAEVIRHIQTGPPLTSENAIVCSSDVIDPDKMELYLSDEDTSEDDDEQLGNEPLAKVKRSVYGPRRTSEPNFGKSPRVGSNEEVAGSATTPGTSSFIASRYRQRKSTPQSLGAATVGPHKRTGPRRNTADTLDISYLDFSQVEESKDMENVVKFAAFFRERRVNLGFTQFDVGFALGKLYGNDFSQTTISRFEALNLSYKNMCKLKPLLQKWLDDTEMAIATGTLANHLEMVRRAESPPDGFRRRRKRTIIENEHKTALEAAYKETQKPTDEQIEGIAETLEMDKEVVRVWFANRRQRERGVYSPSTIRAALNVA